MAVVALTVFVVSYLLIATERVNKVKAALGGAAVIVAAGIAGAQDVFYSHETGIDWNVIFLLLGMMVIVGVLRQTGVFEYTAIWAAKRVKGSALRVMVLLVVITAGSSALLDNVTTVLLIAPVTLLMCERLGVNPVAFLMAEVFASNIGGAATLVGDPPNIIIASRAGLSFNNFLLHMAPLALLVLVAFTAVLPVLFRGSFSVAPERVAEVMSLDERQAIRDGRLLVKCTVIHVEPSLVALLGAGTLIVVTGVDRERYLDSVEWETLLFFAGLFILVGALVKTGVIARLAHLAGVATGGNPLLAAMAILVVSAVLSGVIDNIPYVATMSPVVAELAASVSDPVQAQGLWWSLAAGADFGGNLTAVGASANVVMLGIAAREGYPISFWEFSRKGAIVTALTIAIAAPYVWLRYFAFG
jgi:Na+/H+ antiporter NhaD/arsenite permease-like protein